MHIVHKKVGEENFLSVEKGLALTGFFFEVSLIRFGPDMSNLLKVVDSDNAAIEPLISVLRNITDPKTFVDVSGSTFKVCHKNTLSYSILPSLPRLSDK